MGSVAARPDHDRVLGTFDERALCRFAADIAVVLAPGDVVALHGDLGAGKSTFARALIRAFVDRPDLDVPSPTFTLAQGYDEGRFPVTHFDLYRLTAADELDELGFDDALAEGAAIIEWPELAADRLPPATLELHLAIADDGRARMIIARAGPAWAARLVRTRLIRSFLDEAGFDDARRRYMQGDASTRRYEHIIHDGRSAILMDAEGLRTRPGTPIADYDRIAHRATEMRPFLAVAQLLGDAGFSAPSVMAENQVDSIFLTDDLGTDGIVLGGEPDATRYLASAEALAVLHDSAIHRTYCFADGSSYRIPPFDEAAFQIEAGLLTQWYIPYRTGQPVSSATAEAFSAIWSTLYAKLANAQPTIILRDFHSPNIIWLGEREAHRRVGLIDFQDALWGPGIYDLASLAQDVRVDIPQEMEQALIDRYCAHRNAKIDRAELDIHYAILAAQRNTKILGGFARLHQHLGKSDYLAHMPRVVGYLRRSLENPVLATLRHWYEATLPDVFGPV